MDDLLAALENAPEPDRLAETAVADRAARVLRPRGAFDRLDRVAAWLAGWQRTDTPGVTRPAVLIAAADHGVTVRGVSPYPSEVTAAVVDAIRAGAATSAVMAEQLGATLRVLDVGVGQPSADITSEAALTSERFAAAVHAGREAVRELDCDLLVVGEMGIGNTTAAAAVSAALFGGPPGEWVGPGSGLDAEGVERKRAVVAQAVKRMGGTRPPLEVLRELGGAEMAALTGAVAEARLRSLPVVLDGFVATAAVAPLAVAVPGSLAHCLAGHLSPEPGHRRLLEKLGMEPLLDLGLRLGEGSGALAALPLIRLAAAAVVEVATFEEWGLR
jgi:nicotinate-nucleotide--dimethylbenzimidazole phosphoribosyltransferase